MARTVEDLKALIMAADEYRETINVDYLGETFPVIIKPLTESELTDVQRQIKISLKAFGAMADKVKAGGKITEAEKAELTDKVVEDMLTNDTVNLGDMALTNYLTNKAYCEAGIVDEGLRKMVPKFRYGLTEQISKRIQTISEVPPEVVQNFFGQGSAKTS